MENLQKKNMCDFGKECIFGKGYWQQNKFIWIHEGKNGVYYNGEYVPFYPIKIVLPPIYYNNQTSEQCYIIYTLGNLKWNKNFKTIRNIV